MGDMIVAIELTWKEDRTHITTYYFNPCDITCISARSHLQLLSIDVGRWSYNTRNDCYRNTLFTALVPL